jgi:N-acetyl sugar amidotransferase
MLQYKDVYDQAALEKNSAVNNNRPYQQCTISVMDTIADPNIHFDEKGICNYYYSYKENERNHVFSGDAGRQKLKEMVDAIKKAAKGNKYDCILGLSGGADSTYMAYLAKELGLNPLLVHFDYGWNLETAVQNIEQTVKVLGFDLYTHVMDWEEFKDLLNSYIKASVLDLDVPADHLIFASLARVARKHKIKSILKGYNIVTEGVLPATWNYNRKFDLRNMKNTHKQFGKSKLSTMPKLGVWQQLYYTHIFGLKDFAPLNYIDYNKEKVKATLAKELGWVDYGGKHCENIFTRFYQGYILPQKFNIDKRKAHLSTLIFSGQITKEQALSELAQPAYALQLMEQDKEYIAKKLDFSLAEFEQYLRQPNREHKEFGDESHIEEGFYKLARIMKPITKLFK